MSLRWVSRLVQSIHRRPTRPQVARLGFILGVPRSGTTLLRILLDSHSRILAPSETPWLMGAYGSEISLRALLHRLCREPDGVVANVRGVAEADVYRAACHFTWALFRPAMERSGKRILILKTPDDLAFLDELMRIFPGAPMIHVRRDPRDVALSSIKAPWDRLNWFGENTFENALARWCAWEEKVKDLEGSMNCCHIDFEDLVRMPSPALRTVCGFLGVAYEPAMLEFRRMHHDLPEWELGSQDVARLAAVKPERAFAHRRLVPTAEQRETLERFAARIEALGYRRGWDAGPGIS
jgi:protein-tyrosine sulfotransferase